MYIERRQSYLSLGTPFYIMSCPGLLVSYFINNSILSPYSLINLIPLSINQIEHNVLSWSHKTNIWFCQNVNIIPLSINQSLVWFWQMITVYFQVVCREDRWKFGKEQDCKNLNARSYKWSNVMIWTYLSFGYRKIVPHLEIRLFF